MSQTTGRPLKETEPLAEGSDRMNAAFAALLDTAPVGFIENTGLDVPVRYNERGKSLDLMRQTARNMGDTVERSIQPRQQEHTANRSNQYRQYGRR